MRNYIKGKATSKVWGIIIIIIILYPFNFVVGTSSLC